MKTICSCFAALSCIFVSAAAAASSAEANAPSSAAAEPAAFTVKVSGHGPSMLLIPGLSCPGAVWDETVRHFQDHYTCHVLTLAGFAGAPARPPGPFLEPEREAIATYVREHKLEHPIIVGHSLGGFLALDLAARHPDSVGPLVIVDSVPFLFGVMSPGATIENARAIAATQRQFWEAMDAAAYEQTIRSGRGTRSMVASDENHARIVAWSLASDRATVTTAMTELFSTDLRDEISAITTPTLVLGAWRGYEAYTDQVRTEQNYRAQYSKLRGAKITISATAHHFIMFDDPEWFFAQVDAFLRSSQS